jgi:hypothetical protein
MKRPSFAAISTLPIIVAFALLGTTEARAATCTADPNGCQFYVVTIEQVGPNVVATGSGEFDLSGLTRAGSGTGGFQPTINPLFGILRLGSSRYEIWDARLSTPPPGCSIVAG